MPADCTDPPSALHAYRTANCSGAGSELQPANGICRTTRRCGAPVLGGGRGSSILQCAASCVHSQSQGMGTARGGEAGSNPSAQASPEPFSIFKRTAHEKKLREAWVLHLAAQEKCIQVNCTNELAEPHARATELHAARPSRTPVTGELQPHGEASGHGIPRSRCGRADPCPGRSKRRRPRCVAASQGHESHRSGGGHSSPPHLDEWPPVSGPAERGMVRKGNAGGAAGACFL